MTRAEQALQTIRITEDYQDYMNKLKFPELTRCKLRAHFILSKKNLALQAFSGLQSASGEGMASASCQVMNR